MLDRVLIVDTETTGVDHETDQVVEVGAVLFSVRYGSIIECFSSILQIDDRIDNISEEVHGISKGLLSAEGQCAPPIWGQIDSLVTRLDDHRPGASNADAFVAHQAEFDCSFFPPEISSRLPWICTMNDIEWRRGKVGGSLVNLVLAHGLGVSHAHRALTDCLLIARLFEHYHERDYDLQATLQRGLRPKAKFIALVPFREKDKAKVAGFKWDDIKKEWWRTMAIDDAAKLPFRTKQLP